MENDNSNNITYRKLQRSSSLCDIARSEQSLFDATMLSLPNSSIAESQENKELLEKISFLENQLSSANNEIESLQTENTTLRKELQKLKQKNETNKNTETPNNTVSTQKIVKQKCSSKLLNINKSPELLLQKAQRQCKEIQNSTKQQEPQILSNLNSEGGCSNYKPPNNRNITKSKMCILSSNTKNNLLSIAEKTFSNSFNLCHYLSPHGCTIQLLKDLDTKLQQFTLDDFCILFLGEEDFKSTNNYYDIIFYIRNVMQTMQHTNIIICLPTFKCPFDTSLFNCRVETFNNLLYLDILTHGHAILLDSNLNLEYDYSMFNKYTGSLNNRGLSRIFKDLLDLTTSITEQSQIGISESEKPTELTDNFFLD